MPQAGPQTMQNSAYGTLSKPDVPEESGIEHSIPCTTAGWFTGAAGHLADCRFPTAPSELDVSQHAGVH